MAYRFKLSEPFEDGVRRVGLQQIDRALQHLQSREAPAVAVHATRKGLKRIRALLRLAKPGLGDNVYKLENARYRDIARLLSDQRDGVVVMETVDKFESAASGRTKSAFMAAKARLSHAPEAASDGSDATICGAITALESGRKAMNDLVVTSHKFDAAWEGIERAYRASERAFEIAQETRDDEDVHTWRKRVQYHWRHVTLFSAAWPEEMAARIATAQQLSALLGEDHDIAVMLATLHEAPPQGSIKSAGKSARQREANALTANQRKLAQAFALERQEALRREAHHLSTRLFAESAVAFRQRLETYWASATAAHRVAED